MQRRILEYSGARFKIINIPPSDRSLVWHLTRQRYYGVPILRDGKQVLFELDDDSQVLAKYLDQKFSLGLFPQPWRGIQSILWRYIEHEVEDVCFRLNDSHWKEFVSKKEQLQYLRHKERKFGRGCLDAWAEQRPALLAELERRLIPFEQMLVTRPYLLDDQPRFVDFDLYGMLANYLFTGHYQMPEAHTGLAHWFDRMSTLKLTRTREKLRS